MHEMHDYYNDDSSYNDYYDANGGRKGKKGKGKKDKGKDKEKEKEDKEKKDAERKKKE